MKRRPSKIVTLLLIVVWLCLLLYPTLSDYFNKLHQSTGVQAYEESLRALDDESRQSMWDAAVRYNEQLLQAYQGIEPEGMAAYEDMLNVTDEGTMSVVTIPKIDVEVPIRHGTDEGMLLNHIGHLETSSLPVGGIGTHCVIVGHRGLPSAVLFTDLDKLEVGDIFLLETLGETLAYEVDQILTVLPDQMDALAIDPDADLCTLVTCTPYGVNSHRLLVRGHRTEVPRDPVTGEVKVEVEKHIHPVFFVAGGAAVVLVVLMIWKRPKRKETQE